MWGVVFWESPRSAIDFRDVWKVQVTWSSGAEICFPHSNVKHISYSACTEFCGVSAKPPSNPKKILKVSWESIFHRFSIQNRWKRHGFLWLLKISKKGWEDERTRPKIICRYSSYSQRWVSENLLLSDGVRFCIQRRPNLNARTLNSSCICSQNYLYLATSCRMPNTFRVSPRLHLSLSVVVARYEKIGCLMDR